MSRPHTLFSEMQSRILPHTHRINGVQLSAGGRARMSPSLTSEIAFTQNLDAACTDGLLSVWEPYADTNQSYELDSPAVRDFGSAMNWCCDQLGGSEAAEVRQLRRALAVAEAEANRLRRETAAAEAEAEARRLRALQAETEERRCRQFASADARELVNISNSSEWLQNDGGTVSDRPPKASGTDSSEDSESATSYSVHNES